MSTRYFNTALRTTNSEVIQSTYTKHNIALVFIKSRVIIRSINDRDKNVKHVSERRDRAL